MSRRAAFSVTFWLAFTALVLAIHLAFLRLPFHWDEMGQFVPEALDLYRDGAWIPRSTLPNIHPPLIPALLAGVWQITGVSIQAARVLMLVIASTGVLLTFLLAVRLGRNVEGAPAFAAVLFLVASPLFYAQSMLVLLDMPAMTLTLLALLLFLNERYAWCAITATALVLTKETAITTPLVFGAWLWIRAKRRREALYFLVPVLALGVWAAVLKQHTGFWLGNTGFEQSNVDSAIAPLHLARAILRDIWVLFLSDGKFLGLLALYAGWKLIRGVDWQIALCVAGAQLAPVTFLGGALLERYLLPVLPIVLIAMAVASARYRSEWRWVSHVAMAGLMVGSWFWNPFYPAEFETSWGMIRFIRLQQEAAAYVEAYYAGKRVASAWPFSDAIRNPDFGYVQQPLASVRLRGMDLASIADTGRSQYDVLVVYTRAWPYAGPFDTPWMRSFVRRYSSVLPDATEEQIYGGLGLVLVRRWEQDGQAISIYGPEDEP